MPSKENLKLLNPKRQPLTLHKLRELTSSDLPDEEAEKSLSQ